jgi:hypothetical protein
MSRGVAVEPVSISEHSALVAQLPTEYRELLIQHAPNQAQQDLAGSGPTRSRRLGQ